MRLDCRIWSLVVSNMSIVYPFAAGVAFTLLVILVLYIFDERHEEEDEEALADE